MLGKEIFRLPQTKSDAVIGSVFAVSDLSKNTHWYYILLYSVVLWNNGMKYQRRWVKYDKSEKIKSLEYQSKRWSCFSSTNLLLPRTGSFK